MNKNILKTHLKNGAKIYIVPDSYIDHDIVIKFNNYGTNLDKYVNIYGIQHLLEHCIFFNYKNYNIQSNASTCTTYMSLEFNIPDKKFKILNLLNHWLFLNNDYSTINLSRKLTIEDVKKYINELDNEYIYRNLLNIPWELQTLLISDNKTHYFGGNKYTFENKEKDIQKYLSNPIPISPKNIVIFIKKSKESFYNQINDIFIQLKPIHVKEIQYKLNLDKYYNKIIQINPTNTNSLVFPILYENLKVAVPILYYMRILYPFMNFEINANMCYICFGFNNIHQLYFFYYMLFSKNFDLLSLEKYHANIYPYIDILNIDKYPEEVLSLPIESFSNVYRKQKNNVLLFFEYLSNLVHKKQFIINLTKNFLYNHETSITHDKYYISDANFLDEYFYNYYYYNFDVVDYINNLIYEYTDNESYKNMNTFNNKIYCKPVCNIINVCEKNNKIYNNSLLSVYNNNSNYKITLNIYITSLISYFINSSSINFNEYIKYYVFKPQHLLKSDKNCDIKLSNKIFKIKTEYNFIFMVFKLSHKEITKIYYDLLNLEGFLKQKGLCYYIETSIIKFKKFCLLFIYSNISDSILKETANNIIFFFKSNYYNINTSVVLSYKSKERNFSNLNKNIKCVF